MQNSPSTIRGALRRVVWIGLLPLVGCSAVAQPELPEWFAAPKWTSLGGTDAPAERIVAVWTDTIMHQPGQRGVRGIGGRIIFYPDGSDESLEVDGQLTVYAYDDSQSPAAGAPPARKFVFTPEQLANRHSKSQVGDSYSVWLPWDEVGNPSRALTLIARFEPTNGPTVISEPANQLLPGTTVQPTVQQTQLKTKIQAKPEGSGEVVQAAHQVDAARGSQAQSKAPADGLDTFTIDIPNDVSLRWREQATRSPATIPTPRALPAPAPPTASAAKPDARRVESAAPSARPTRKRLSLQRVANPHFRE